MDEFSISIIRLSFCLIVNERLAFFKIILSRSIFHNIEIYLSNSAFRSKTLWMKGRFLLNFTVHDSMKSLATGKKFWIGRVWIIEVPLQECTQIVARLYFWTEIQWIFRCHMKSVSIPLLIRRFCHYHISVHINCWNHHYLFIYTLFCWCVRRGASKVCY